MNPRRRRLGTENGRSKLNEHLVREIRRRFMGGEKPSHLAKKFDVSSATVHHIITRKTWDHVA